jgi:hypothetical protein
LDGRSRPPGYCRLSTARRFRTGSYVTSALAPTPAIARSSPRP